MPTSVSLLSPSGFLAALPLEGNPGKQSGAPPAVFLLSPSGSLRLSRYAARSFLAFPFGESGERMRAERGREETKKDKFKIFVNQSDITEDVKKSV